jgi:hypothetical protein
MALANCKDCGREVSTRARHCVHCGRPWPSQKCCAPLATGLIAGLIALTAVGGVVLVKNNCRKLRECRIERSERGAGAPQRELIRFIDSEGPKAVEERK